MICRSVFGCERRQGRKLRRARSTGAPGRLKDAGSPLALTVDTLTNIVVAPRCHKAWIFAHGIVIGSGLGYGEPRLSRQLNAFEFAPASAYASKIGATIDPP